MYVDNVFVFKLRMFYVRNSVLYPQFWILFLGELNQYVTNFQWDSAKYPLMKPTTLRNLAEIISKVSSLSLLIFFILLWETLVFDIMISL